MRACYLKPIRKCSMCRVEKPREEFNSTSFYCKPCAKAWRQTPEQRTKSNARHKDYLRTHRAEMNEYNHSRRAQALVYEREYRRKGIYKDQVYCRRAIGHAVRRGKIIKPSHCSQCGRVGPIEAHHPSYKREDWNKVIWLCHDCHNAIPRRFTKRSPISNPMSG